LRRDTFGFLIPAVMFFAHWVFWRARADEAQTRLVFGASMLLFAAFITVEAVRAQNIPDWTRAMAGAASFAPPLGLHFAPGTVTPSGPPGRRQFEKNRQGDRSRQQRRQLRENAG